MVAHKLDFFPHLQWDVYSTKAKHNKNNFSPTPSNLKNTFIMEEEGFNVDY